jgi:hypothetical protein
MPIYRAMLEKGMKEDAARIFLLAKEGYHSVSRKSVEGLLKQ